MRTLTLLFIAVLFTFPTYAQQVLKLGQAAPDFTGQALDGQTYSLSQLQGKVILITFWSTRCQICHSEIPKLNQVAERYKGQDVVFLAATMENPTKVESYIQKNPFNFSILPNSFAVVLQYADRDNKGNINMGFPAHFLIDRRGSIVMRTYGWDKAENIDSHIKKQLSLY